MSRWKTRWAVGVVIPAQNEEATIASCVGSVLTALATAGVENRWVIVVADLCADQTVDRARHALGGDGEVLEVRVRSAGSARREGATRLMQLWDRLNPAEIWLANTDGDSCVSENWITVQLELAEKGVTAVAGIVTLDPQGPPAAQAVYRDTYVTGVEGTHTHVHGANLAVRADAYEDVGGWGHLALAEDHCLWSRLRGRGWRTSSPVSSIVVTSARLVGRAQGGFADTLKACIGSLHAKP